MVLRLIELNCLMVKFINLNLFWNVCVLIIKIDPFFVPLKKMKLLFIILSFFTFVYCFERPNILFIVADDLGWHDVGYHDSELRTPTIDKLAQEGIKLENYYVEYVCTPSRAV